MPPVVKAHQRGGIGNSPAQLQVSHLPLGSRAFAAGVGAHTRLTPQYELFRGVQVLAGPLTLQGNKARQAGKNDELMAQCLAKLVKKPSRLCPCGITTLGR